MVPTTLDEKCPQCGEALVERTGKFGAFIACSTYPKCKYSRPKTTGVTCPECGKGEVTQRRSKKGKTFYSCSTYPDCKWIANYKPCLRLAPIARTLIWKKNSAKTEAPTISARNVNTSWSKAQCTFPMASEARFPA
ncbi:MAG: topoisomerase DNA-binding C4 zinc finger domain-containing protein [Candidatus Cloacimonetes bacterium]|nr:topoisomerase DNA-binding C4 zinc finger domain-containing protein [Candidatus Cloacimonadota bacterium]